MKKIICTIFTAFLLVAMSDGAMAMQRVVAQMNQASPDAGNALCFNVISLRDAIATLEKALSNPSPNDNIEELRNLISALRRDLEHSIQSARELGRTCS